MVAITGTIVNSGVSALGPDGENINNVKSLFLETDNLADAADTVPITLAPLGITTVLGVTGYKHTTDNSVVAKEQPTTAVAAGVLTITVPAGTDNDKRIYQIHFI